MNKVVKYKYKEFDTWLEDCPKITLGFIYMDSELYVAYNNICDALGISFKQAKDIGIGQEHISFTMDRYNSDKVGVNNRGPEGSKFIKVCFITGKLFYTNNIRYKCICNILNKFEEDKINIFNFTSYYNVDIESTEIQETKKPVIVVNMIDKYQKIHGKVLHPYTHRTYIRAVLYANEWYFALTDIRQLLGISPEFYNELISFAPTIQVCGVDKSLYKGETITTSKGLYFIPKSTIINYLESDNCAVYNKDNLERKNILIDFFSTDFSEYNNWQKDLNVRREIMTVSQQRLFKFNNHNIRVCLINDIPYISTLDILHIYKPKSRYAHNNFIILSKCSESNFKILPFGAEENNSIWKISGTKGLSMANLNATLAIIDNIRVRKSKQPLKKFLTVMINKEYYADTVSTGNTDIHSEKKLIISAHNQKVINQKTSVFNGKSFRFGDINGNTYVVVRDIFNYFNKGTRHSTESIIKISRSNPANFINISRNNLENNDIWSFRGGSGACLVNVQAVKDIFDNYYAFKYNNISEIKEFILSNMTNDNIDYPISNSDVDTVEDKTPSIDTDNVSTHSDTVNAIDMEKAIKPVFAVDDVTEQIDKLIKNTYEDKLSLMEHKYTILRKICDSLGEDIKLFKELG